MISEFDQQVLVSLKNDINFKTFLSTSTNQVDEVYRILEEFLNQQSADKINYSSYIGRAKLLESDISSSFSMVTENTSMYDYTGVIKKYNHNSVKSEAETDVSAYSSRKTVNKVLFKVLKKDTHGSSKISFRTDCIRKKIKSMFHKYLISKLNKTLQSNSISFSFKALPKHLSISLNLKENKQWAAMSIRELMISEEVTLSGFDKANLYHNIKVLNHISIPEIDECLNKKWTTVFNDFLCSEEFSKSIKELENINKSYAARFRKHSLSLLCFIDH
jgi:hypothetical protein